MKNLELFKNKLSAIIRHYGFALSLLFAGLMISGNMWGGKHTHDVYVKDNGGKLTDNNWHFYFNPWWDGGSACIEMESLGDGVYVYRTTDYGYIKFRFIVNPSDKGCNYDDNKWKSYDQDYGAYEDDHCCFYTADGNWGKMPVINFHHDVFLYDDGSKMTTDPKKLHMWGSYGENDITLKYLGDGVYVAEGSGSATEMDGYCIISGSTNVTGDITRSQTRRSQNAGNCCLYTGDNGWGIPPLYNLKLKLNTTNYGGSGTDASPYIVYSGIGNVSVTNQSTVASTQDVGAEYRWKSIGDWTSWQKDYKDDSFSITKGQKVHVESEGRAEYGGNRSVERGVSFYVQASAYKRTAKAYYIMFGQSSTAGSMGGTVKVSGGTAGSTASDIKKWSTATTFEAIPNTAGGFKFLGWFDNRFGTGTALSTALTYPVTNSDATDSDKTVYAIFENDNPAPIVYIADTAHIAAGPEVTLYGYLKLTGCIEDINEYGFKYGTSCSSLTNVASSSTEQMKQSATFSKLINKNLEAKTTYKYKAYVKSATLGEFISAECGTFTTREGCIYPAGDTIYYTIDSSADESDCSLVFNTIEDALSNLKTKHNNSAVTSEYWWNSSSSMLVKNIVFSIVPNKAGYGVSGERVDLSNINKFDESKETNPKPDKEFILRSAISGTKPLVYGLNLENSRKVTLDGILVRRVVSSGTGMGTACILVGLNKETNDLKVGKMTDAMLTIKNCAIDATAFCCIHGQGIDGLYMENNDLIAACPGNDSNANNWGASMKFMNSENIVLLRNNFKGAHSNNIFAQNVRNVLIMNNVFWNDNKLFTTGSGDNNSAIIRLINYGADNDDHKVQNIGMYYNTMYLADNSDNSKSVNFLTLGGKASGSPAQSKDATYYDFNTIDFKYNNCYSYDKDVPGKTIDAFCSVDISKSTHITTNNFWAAKSGADFSFGSETKNIDMSLTGGIVCETASNTPEGLVIKGSGLNLGEHLTSDVAGVNISGTTYPAKDIYSDRRNTEIRPKSISPWTLGAFQQSMGGTVHQIIWNGDLNDNWDNRNNWVKMVGDQAVLVTCVDDLAEDLEVIIPEPYSTKYPRLKSDHISRYPVIPVWSEPSNAEQVRAGLTSATIGTVSEFANKISIEYGGTIKGVENLGAAEHYTGTEGQLTTDRKEWVLVGTVVKPFVEGESGAVRNIKSRDFYIENHMPHVYMNQIGESGGDINFGVPFTSLDEEVSANTAFAIQVADQYGAYKLPASVYFLREEPDPSRVGEGTMPHTYQFVGRFANDEALPTLSLSTGYNFLNNSYPSVLDANLLATHLGGDYAIKLYNYTDCAWDDIKSVPEYDQKIKPQSGFVIIANTAAEKQLTQELYDGTYSGKYKPTLKSVSAESGLVLRAYNTVNNKGSNVGIWYDYKDIEKAFNTSVTDNAELYILKGDGKYSTVTMADVSAVIPLGIRNKSTAPFTVKFEITNSEGIESAVLEDRGVEPVAYYDLLDESTNAFFQHIMPGDLEGRFFLNLNYADDDDIPTDDDDVTTSNADIDLYGDGNSIIISSSENVMLKSAEITDMSGRTTVVDLKNAHYNKINVKGAQGVYVVKAIGDTKTETAKVIVK